MQHRNRSGLLTVRPARHKARPADSGGAEINADGIECSFCTAQHNGGSPAYRAIRTILCHEISAYRQGSAAADGTHQNQSGSFRRNSKERKNRGEKICCGFHGAGGSKHMNSSQQSNQSRSNGDQELQPAGCPGQKLFIYFSRRPRAKARPPSAESE